MVYHSSWFTTHLLSLPLTFTHFLGRVGKGLSKTAKSVIRSVKNNIDSTDDIIPANSTLAKMGELLFGKKKKTLRRYEYQSVLAQY